VYILTVHLKEKVGTQRLEAACKRALHYGDPRYIRVKTILAAGLEDELSEEEMGITVSDQRYRYARSASSFFYQELR